MITYRVRNLILVLVWVVLLGGYGLSQVYQIQGRLEEWTEKISGPNLYFGWLVVVLLIFLGLCKSEGEEQD